MLANQADLTKFGVHNLSPKWKRVDYDTMSITLKSRSETTLPLSIVLSNCAKDSPTKYIRGREREKRTKERKREKERERERGRYKD